MDKTRDESTKSSTEFSAVNQDTEKTPPPKPAVNDAPDGGFEAWLVVFGVWCTSFCSFGWINSIGVFQDYYQNVLLSDYSPGTVSWIPSLQIFFMMGMGPFVGILCDNFGVRWLLLFGSFFHVFGIMMASLGREYYQILLAQGVCSAIGASAIFQPSLSCVSGWFNKNRATAFGVLFTGSSVGGVVFPIMVSHLIREIGFGWAMRISGFLILFLLIIANLTVRARVPPHPQKVTLAQLRKPFTDLDFNMVNLGCLFFAFGFYIPINYLEVEALQTGMNPNLVQYLIPMLNAASLFGRLSAGVLGDKVGRYNVFILASGMSALWVLALWLPDTSDAAIIAFAVLFGFFSGAYISLIVVLVMQISPLAETGFRTGIILFALAIAGLITNPINGAILNHGGWTGVKVFSGVFCAFGTVCVLVTRMRRTGGKVLAVF